MLNPSNDRLDYGEVLAPPADYYLDFAVGTTYSLDLDALVGASLAMGLSEETDSVLMNNPVCLLEALRSTGDKVALFCEGGQIHLPSNVTQLYILLEKMVFPVKTSKDKSIAQFPSFHPKFWLIKYRNAKGEFIYRVIVLSRNLTFDRSWDVTYFMDGKPVRHATDKNEPLCDFLGYLIMQVPDDENGRKKASEIQGLVRELAKVEFVPAEREFYDYEFIPNGVKKRTGGFYQFNETDLFKQTFHEILIMSPFISNGIIHDFNHRNDGYGIADPQYALFTREMSLGKLKEDDVSNFSIYTLKDKVVDGESAISEDMGSISKQDIHAKIFMIKKYRTTDLYLGSLNASHNAVYGNVEFMLRLTTKNRYLNMEKLKHSLFCGEEDNPDNPFQRVSLQNAIIEEEDEKKSALDNVIKEINRSNPYATAKMETEDHYSVSVFFEKCDCKDYNVTLRPLLSNRVEWFGEDIYFAKLTVDQLSEFYVISVSDGESTVERVLIIHTDGLPEDRERAVVSKIVNDKDCFYRYIAFLLGDDSILSVLEANETGAGTADKSAWKQYQVPALYEKMLQTAANNPEKFKGIEYLMRTISEDGIIPDDFVKLYETFKKAVKLDV